MDEEKGLERYLTNLTAVTQLGNLQNVYNHELLNISAKNLKE